MDNIQASPGSPEDINEQSLLQMQVNKEGVKTLTYLQSNIQSTTDESEHNRKNSY